MNLFTLALAVLLPIPTCTYRMKRYGLNGLQTVIVYIVISTVGAGGACVGSYLAGGSILGIRLYGLMLFDAVVLPLVGLLIRHDLPRLGDFVSVPIMVSCAAAKIVCLVTNCCRGVIMAHADSPNTIRFPSQTVELLIWVAMAAILLLLEHKGKLQRLMWPFSMVWFGFFRFAVDFFRDPEQIQAVILPGLSGSKFWSLVVMVYGLVWLWIVLKLRLGENPSIKNFGKTLLGMI